MSRVVLSYEKEGKLEDAAWLFQKSNENVDFADVLCSLC